MAELLFPALGIGRISATPAGREFRTAQWQAGRTWVTDAVPKALTPPTEAPGRRCPGGHELRRAEGRASCSEKPSRAVGARAIGARAVAADAIGGEAVRAPSRLGSGRAAAQVAAGGSATAQAGGE